MGRVERALIGIGGFLFAVFVGGQIGRRIFHKDDKSEVKDAPRPVPSSLAAPMLTAPRLSCPVNMIQGGSVCYPLVTDYAEGVTLVALPNSHAINGTSLRYEQIPRRPDRPEDYELYMYPVPPGLSGGRSVSAGYDLDRPENDQRKISAASIGHGGVDLPGVRGNPVKLVALEHQQGEAELLFAGTLWGNTAIVRHARREGGSVHDYIVLYAHMENLSKKLVARQALSPGEVLGTVGDSGSTPGATHVHLEVRRARDGVDVREVVDVADPGHALLGETIVCDPRNVLPLRPAR